MSKLSLASSSSSASSVCAHEPQLITIAFDKLTYSVQPKTGGPPLAILKGISGSVLPSRVLAIMGSSGAGKTTVCC